MFFYLFILIMKTLMLFVKNALKEYISASEKNIIFKYL